MHEPAKQVLKAGVMFRAAVGSSLTHSQGEGMKRREDREMERPREAASAAGAGFLSETGHRSGASSGQSASLRVPLRIVPNTGPGFNWRFEIRTRVLINSHASARRDQSCVPPSKVRDT